MKRLAAIVYSTNNLAYTQLALEHVLITHCSQCTEIVAVDNGSPEPYPDDLPGDLLIRYEQNIGGNAVFHRWLIDDWFDGDPPEFLAFFHCDLMIHEVGWDKRVLAAFDADPQLNLIGFVGSNEIDEFGGRGGGTMLNYAGKFFEGIGQASPAEHHGRRMTGLEPAAVLDHCAMIFRRTALENITPQEGYYAPEHFYDKIMSCEILEQGGHVAVLGVSVDHFSGGIGAGVAQAEALRIQWLNDQGVIYPEGRSHDAVYIESERRFKNRFFRNGFAPLKVMPDYSIVRPEPR